LWANEKERDVATVQESAVMLLVDQFETAVRVAAASVERMPRSAERLAEAVSRLEPEAKRIAVAEPLDLPTQLFESCRRLPGAFVGRSKHDLESADVGVTDAFAGVARTGSVCVSVDHNYLGYISLLSRAHLVVLAATDIVERPGDLLRPDCLDGKGLGRSFVFITGPSATADMGPLVHGVHGPHRLHVIILV
jgi:L-lactate dehydrogenase complex protein LldG